MPPSQDHVETPRQIPGGATSPGLLLAFVLRDCDVHGAARGVVRAVAALDRDGVDAPVPGTGTFGAQINGQVARDLPVGTRVAIADGGNVVTRDDVELKDRILRTKDGRAVATIKENTWYARTRQWHQVRPNLVRRERQAMHRFYPNLNMSTTPTGDLCWQGSVTTWTGNAYEIMLQYPARFPYAPPKAFVVNPKIPQSRHIYKDGHLCLFHKDDKAWQMETTAATMMSWVSLWLHCFEVWQETGTWPRREADDLVITTDY